MNLKFLSKTFGTIGLIAALSAVIGTVPLQTVQAQIETGVPADIDDEACIASGLHSFHLLQNIDLSPEQLEKIHMNLLEKERANSSLIESYPGEIDPSSLQYVTRPGVEVPPDVREALNSALSVTLTADSAATAIAALNEEFAEYAEFGIGETVRFTDAQKAELRQLSEEFEARNVSFLTPEQLQQYQENLATESRLYAVCGMADLDIDDITGVTTSFEPSFY
jgi:hypothetical protein